MKLVDCVLCEDDKVLTFAAWWKTVDEDDVVEVQYPHNHHGLAGKPSNHAKQDVTAEFLYLVDNNSQPSGRQESNYSSNVFFLPQFIRIVAPAEGEKNFEESAGHQLWHSSTELSWRRDDPPALLQHSGKGMASQAQIQSSLPPLHYRLL